MELDNATPLYAVRLMLGSLLYKALSKADLVLECKTHP